MRRSSDGSAVASEISDGPLQSRLVVFDASASLGVREWDYEDRRRVMIQRNGVTRVRPALTKEWTAEFQFLINLPEYVPPDALNDTLVNAGRLIGLAEFGPTYGRSAITRFENALP